MHLSNNFRHLIDYFHERDHDVKHYKIILMGKVIKCDVQYSNSFNNVYRNIYFMNYSLDNKDSLMMIDKSDYGN